MLIIEEFNVHDLCNFCIFTPFRSPLLAFKILKEPISNLFFTINLGHSVYHGLVATHMDYRCMVSHFSLKYIKIPVNTVTQRFLVVLSVCSSSHYNDYI